MALAQDAAVALLARRDSWRRTATRRRTARGGFPPPRTPRPRARGSPRPACGQFAGGVPASGNPKASCSSARASSEQVRWSSWAWPSRNKERIHIHRDTRCSIRRALANCSCWTARRSRGGHLYAGPRRRTGGGGGARARIRSTGSSTRSGRTKDTRAADVRQTPRWRAKLSRKPRTNRFLWVSVNSIPGCSRKSETVLAGSSQPKYSKSRNTHSLPAAQQGVVKAEIGGAQGPLRCGGNSASGSQSRQAPATICSMAGVNSADRKPRNSASSARPDSWLGLQSGPAGPASTAASRRRRNRRRAAGRHGRTSRPVVPVPSTGKEGRRGADIRLRQRGGGDLDAVDELVRRAAGRLVGGQWPPEHCGCRCWRRKSSAANSRARQLRLSARGK